MPLYIISLDIPSPSEADAKKFIFFCKLAVVFFFKYSLFALFIDLIRLFISTPKIFGITA